MSSDDGFSPADDDLPDNASPAEHAALRRTRTVANLLDEAIRVPGTNYRIGIDPIVGLLPVSGDIVTGLIGLYIVAEAAFVGTPPAVLARMVGNVLADVVVGSIPIVGDAFDAVWKSNVKNVDLFEDHIRSTTATEFDR
jgi:hypothetical protein